jgi:antitoxin (DNA-binding transcriptional repressor) of toxin-antitoxin stability system
MKTASVRDLRNRYTSLLSWIGAGEDVVITRRGKVIARLVPEQGESAPTVDWSGSPAIRRDRAGARTLSSKASRALRQEAAGKW